MPYIPHTDADREAMLATIGVDSIDRLFREIPQDLLLNRELKVPSALDEHRLYRHMAGIAAKNRNLQDVTCFLGAGMYDRYIPATVQAVISRGEFLTAYTPYQPEVSQGYLQTIYEFQSMIAELYGMDLANASMYDGATSMAEAAILASGMNSRTKVVISNAVHPHYREVMNTYAWSCGLTVQEFSHQNGSGGDLSSLDGDAACLIVQTPNFFGQIEELTRFGDAARASGALFIVVADPVAMALLPPPGEFGADIVVGEGQPLGVPLGLGGPAVGLFAARREHVRRIPGRIVGKTVDHSDRPGYVMTLRTREQDIRREKATSNICTNEALMALAATVYLAAMGKNGLRQVAEASVRNARYAATKLTEAGATMKFHGKYFQEFVISLPRSAEAVRDRLLDHGILAGLPLGAYDPTMEKDLLVATTEIRTAAEIDAFATALKKVLA